MLRRYSHIALHTERAATWKGALKELQAQQPTRCEGKSQKWVQKQVKDLIEFKEKGAFQEMVRTAILGKGEKFKWKSDLTADLVCIQLRIL